MSNFINEITVMNYYIEQIDKDSIVFLKGRDEYKKSIREMVIDLRDAETMNAKIQVATKLWKKLFEASMSSISPDRSGYDKIFSFFDAYVEFEELIFASDSFYRDHTLHCIWVYFLGEYIIREPQFSVIFTEMNSERVQLDALVKILPNTDMARRIAGILYKSIERNDALRCVSALTHDLGYPLKKIEKINKSIKKVLPYFAVTSFDDFTFEYSNIQQEFIGNYIDFISRALMTSLNLGNSNGTDNEANKCMEILEKCFVFDKYGRATEVNNENIEKITKEEVELLEKNIKFEVTFPLEISSQNMFLNDFENYQHGIMSGFLLMKNLGAFQDINYDKIKSVLDTQEMNAHPAERMITLGRILQAIALHTSEEFRIARIEETAFLTFVDELEEFSRISRASQNREYVKEFCESSIEMGEDDWLDITFIFNNSELDNLDPERAFKGRCKRFLTLFDIPNLSPYLKIRVTVIGKLPTNNNTYVLEIARNYADIMINGESVSIPKYLKSTQFATKEEYALM